MMAVIKDTVYDIPKEIVAAWIVMSPDFNNRMLEMWLTYAKEHNIPKEKVHDDAEVDAFIIEHNEPYRDLLVDIILDIRNRMESEFEDYKVTEVTVDEVLENSEWNALNIVLKS